MSEVSLRDYFAGKALEGLCANIDWAQLEDLQKATSSELEFMTEVCYNLADAMVEKRKEKWKA